MALRIVLMGFLVAMVGGCATAKKSAQIQDLEMQVSDLQLQLQQRDERIHSLESELTGVQQKSSKKNEILSKADFAKPDTRSVQKALKAVGFYDGLVDGKLGPKTQAAVREFQKSGGLKEDGVVGRQTWAEMSEHIE